MFSDFFTNETAMWTELKLNRGCTRLEKILRAARIENHRKYLYFLGSLVSLNPSRPHVARVFETPDLNYNL
jgi:hypothetical protein